jgi:4-carboxymuconolactone decarboxylase
MTMRSSLMSPAAAAAFRDVMCTDPPEDLTVRQARALEHEFGGLWTAPGLGRRDRRLVTMTCLAYAIKPEPLRAHVYAALSSGDLTIEEMLEVVLHFAVYCGWPKASNLEMHLRTCWAQVQRERGEDPRPLPARGNDELGLSDWEARIQRGEQEFRDVNLISAPPRDTPYQHSGILGYVFGHVWQRPGLSRRDRRLVTVASVGLCEAPVPIASHVGSALQSGDIPRPEMDELIRHFAAYAGTARAEALTAAANGTLTITTAVRP